MDPEEVEERDGLESETETGPQDVDAEAFAAEPASGAPAPSVDGGAAGSQAPPGPPPPDATDTGAPPPPAAPNAPQPTSGRGVGRGRGRGRPRGSGRGRTAGRGQDPGRGRGEAGGTTVPPAPPAASGSQTQAPTFEDLDPDNAPTRPAFSGETEDWELTPEVDLSHEAHPVEFFLLMLSLAYWKAVAANSNKYMGKCRMEGVTKYPDAKKFTLATVFLYVAALICNGLNPSISQEFLFRDSLAFNGSPIKQFLTRERWREVRAFIHISDPNPLVARARGHPNFDELHKVRPLLVEFMSNAQRLVRPGKCLAIDEITIGFQGHQSALKQRCGKFKKAGDGFQADAVVLAGGFVWAFVFRGDNTAPTIVKALSPLHNRCLYILSMLFATGLSGFWLFWDNLYPSLKVVQLLARLRARSQSSRCGTWSSWRRLPRGSSSWPTTTCSRPIRCVWTPLRRPSSSSARASSAASRGPPSPPRVGPLPDRLAAPRHASAP